MLPYTETAFSTDSVKKKLAITLLMAGKHQEFVRDFPSAKYF